MNKNVAALLRVDHAQLSELRPIVSRHVKQSPVADLPAHLRVEGVRSRTTLTSSFFLPGRTVSTTASVSRKSYPRNFVGSTSSSPSSTLISSFFCALRARSRCSSINLSKPSNIDRESAFARHQFREIERKAIGVVKLNAIAGTGHSRQICPHRPRLRHRRTIRTASLWHDLESSPSKSSMPLSRVLLKPSSSRRIVSLILLVSPGLRETLRPWSFARRPPA